MKCLSYIILFLQIAFGPLEAKASYKLEELTRIALEKSKLLHAKQYELSSIDGASIQARVWQNPSISMRAGMKLEDANSGYWYNLNLLQPFYFPGKQNLRSDIQDSFKKDINLELEQIKRFIFYSVVFLAFAYNEAIEHSEHLSERRSRFRIIQKYLNSRPFVSPQKRLEKILMQNKMLLLEKEILEVKNKQRAIWEGLNFYLEMNTPIRITIKWFVKGIELDLKTLQQSLNSNPVLLFQKNQIVRKSLQKSLAEKEKYPDFSLSGIYTEERVAQIDRLFGAGITFSLPLWNRNQGKSLQYKDELASAQAKSFFLEKEIFMKLNTAYLDYTNKRTLVQKYPIQMLDTIHKQMAYADREFKKGRIDMLSYMELEEISSQLHDTIFESQVEYLRSYLKILSITGSISFKEEE